MTQPEFAKRLADLKTAIIGAMPPTGDPESKAIASMALAALDVAEELLLDVKRIADAAQR